MGKGARAFKCVQEHARSCVAIQECACVHVKIFEDV